MSAQPIASEILPSIKMDQKAERAARLLRRAQRRKLQAGKLYAQADEDLKKAAQLIGARRVVEIAQGEYGFLEDQFAEKTEVWAHAAARRAAARHSGLSTWAKPASAVSASSSSAPRSEGWCRPWEKWSSWTS